MSLIPLNLIFSAPLPVQIGYFVLSLLIAIAGYNRKMGFWGYLFASILLSPIMGFLLVVVSDKRHKKAS